MTINTRKIGLTLLQVFAGCCAGFLAGWIALTLVNLAWDNLQSMSMGIFLKGILLLISFLIVFGTAVIATAEAVKQMGRFMPKSASRRKIYEGSFLGICAAVALLTLTRGDWMNTLEEWAGPLKVLATLFYFIVVIPLKLVIYWFPPFFLLLISAPIGAAIAYNLSLNVGSESRHQESKKDREKRS